MPPRPSGSRISYGPNRVPVAKPLPRDPGQERRRVGGGGAVEESILGPGYAVEQSLDRPSQLGVGGAGAVEPRGPRRGLECEREVHHPADLRPRRARFRSRRRRADGPRLAAAAGPLTRSAPGTAIHAP